MTCHKHPFTSLMLPENDCISCWQERIEILEENMQLMTETGQRLAGERNAAEARFDALLQAALDLVK